MSKATAISIFGTQKAMAKAIDITSEAISQWPEVLTPKCQDRVEAAIHRKGLTEKMQAALRASRKQMKP